MLGGSNGVFRENYGKFRVKTNFRQDNFKALKGQIHNLLESVTLHLCSFLSFLNKTSYIVFDYSLNI